MVCAVFHASGSFRKNMSRNCEDTLQNESCHFKLHTEKRNKHLQKICLSHDIFWCKTMMIWIYSIWRFWILNIFFIFLLCSLRRINVTYHIINYTNILFISKNLLYTSIEVSKKVYIQRVNHGSFRCVSFNDSFVVPLS